MSTARSEKRALWRLVGEAAAVKPMHMHECTRSHNVVAGRAYSRLGREPGASNCTLPALLINRRMGRGILGSTAVAV